MIICKVWDAEYPWDVRVEKVCASLHLAGHDVHLVARNRDRRPLQENLGTATIHRLRPIPRLGRRLESASMFPAFFNPRWIRIISRVVSRHKADLLLCRDLPLAPTCLWVARRANIPLVVDFAEDYPGLLAQLYNRRDFRLMNLFVRNPLLASLLERYVVRRAAGVVVVTDEAAARIRSLGVARDQITVVSNTPTRQRVEAIPVRSRASEDGALRLVYLGLLEEARGIDMMLRSLARKHSRPDLTIDFFGSDAGDRWQQRAVSLGVADRTTFHGYVPYDTALARLRNFDVGVMPHHLSRHIQTTLPNKLFDYMAAALPVLATDAAPVTRVLRDEACGLVFPDRDIVAFLDACDRLSQASLRTRMGRAGRSAVERTYNWDADSGRLIAFIERVFERSTARSS